LGKILVLIIKIASIYYESIDNTKLLIKKTEINFPRLFSSYNSYLYIKYV